MTLVLLLTAAQAAAVEGETTPGHALEPVQIAPGQYILPLAVLDDPAHAMRHELLATLPRIDYTPPPVSEDQP